MQSTQLANSHIPTSWLVPDRAPGPDDFLPVRPDLDDAPNGAAAPPREHDARAEIARLRDEIEHLVLNQRDNPRDAVDSALESVTRLQIVTANIDACGPPSASFAGAALVALADAQLRGHTDAIERGMTYTADNQLRLLNDENARDEAETAPEAG